jgi:hypothetical protein
VRSVSAGSRDLLNVELDHAIALIAAAGEHAPCGHNWPILRKRGRGCAVATLGFALAEESKLFLTPRGRSSAHAKSTGRDLPTDFAVGRTHNRCSILRDRDTGDRWPRTSHESPCPEANACPSSSCPACNPGGGSTLRDETGVGTLTHRRPRVSRADDRSLQPVKTPPRSRRKWR